MKLKIFSILLISIFNTFGMQDQEDKSAQEAKEKLTNCLEECKNDPTYENCEFMCHIFYRWDMEEVNSKNTKVD